MSHFKPIALVLVLLIIGPAMYVFSRAHSLTMAFARVNVGDTQDRVAGVLGKPQGRSESAAGRLEYRYSSWPLPTVWIVRFGDGRVVEKLETSAH